ncbi:MAG: hypothetical protein M3313_15725 [Actinomycetota bacterium]|nr:hypothetical protein [Actinomycetota bacterium]
MLIVSAVFEALARAEAKSFGATGLPILVVPHPVGSRSVETLRGWGQGLIEPAVSGLTGGKS